MVNNCGHWTYEPYTPTNKKCWLDLIADWITSTDSYNHFVYQLHHFIKKQSYERNKKWYKEKGIEQKLILLPTQCHIDLHNCISNFKEKWGIPRKELLYDAKF